MVTIFYGKLTGVNISSISVIGSGHYFLTGVNIFKENGYLFERIIMRELVGGGAGVIILWG